MNVVIYFLAAISLPLLISGQPYVDLGLWDIRLFKMENEKSVDEMTSKEDSFDSVVEQCKKKVNWIEPDVFACLSENYYKIGTEDIPCCIRVAQYKCMKTFLTTKCNVTKEEVEKNDEDHFNYWNNLDMAYKGNCTGNSEESLQHCNLNNGMSLITWSFTLQLVSLFTLYSFLAKFNLAILIFKL